jgi:multidrug transporter EmrE-like cation transporter
MKWIILICGIAANAGASVLVKKAMLPPHRLPTLHDPIAALTNWPLWLGLILYGTTFVLYAASLARLPLNVAHPVLTSGAVATVAVLSIVIFREPFYWTTAVGVFLVLAGVVMITARVS